jgi:SH3-like domain-containing protein
MKTQIIFMLLAVFAGLNANSQTISISKKNSDDPSVVCNNSIYYYVTTITGAPSEYTVSWVYTHAEIPTQSTAEAKVKWTASSDADGYIGTIKAQLKTSSGTLLVTSNEIEVTIKSIKHLKT